MWHEEFRKLLLNAFSAHTRKNPKFSVRAFAKKTGLSPGSLSQVLSGTMDWKLSSARAALILEKLELKQSVKNRLLVQMGERPRHVKKTLPASDYDTLTDWTYGPILAAFDLPEPLLASAEIAKRLGISVQRVDAVVRDLLKRGMLVKSGETIRRQEVFVQTSDGIPSEIIRKHHEMNLELSHRALVELPAPERDFTALTFAGSRAQMDALRAEIRALYEKASSLMNSEEENDNVFHLSVHLFPYEFGTKK